MSRPRRTAPAGQGSLRFGTGGVPRSSPAPDAVSGVETVAALGLSAMELEFVQGVRLQEASAARIRERAQALDVALTCHGPYYINLNAAEPEKRQASRRRILETARAAQLVGARSITFHAAFYLGQDPEAVHRTVREELRGIVETLRDEGNTVQIRPELTGKPSQYGSLEELLRLSTEVPGVLPCIDFSHAHARSGGAQNSAAEFEEMLSQVRAALGAEALLDLHLHVSGIEYTPKGERRHLDLPAADLRYQELLRALAAVRAGGVLVCESPSLEEDALRMQRLYRTLKA
ncbi:MAG: TIM barrel protein [Myxococcales bacterium]|nr:TIM barrel protein [Myxococcales bacterium]